LNQNLVQSAANVSFNILGSATNLYTERG